MERKGRIEMAYRTSAWIHARALKDVQSKREDYNEAIKGLLNRIGKRNWAREGVWQKEIIAVWGCCVCVKWAIPLIDHYCAIFRRGWSGWYGSGKNWRKSSRLGKRWGHNCRRGQDRGENGLNGRRGDCRSSCCSDFNSSIRPVQLPYVFLQVEIAAEALPTVFALEWL